MTSSAHRDLGMQWWNVFSKIGEFEPMEFDATGGPFTTEKDVARNYEAIDQFGAIVWDYQNDRLSDDEAYWRIIKVMADQQWTVFNLYVGLEDYSENNSLADLKGMEQRLRDAVDLEDLQGNKRPQAEVDAERNELSEAFAKTKRDALTSLHQVCGTHRPAVASAAPVTHAKPAPAPQPSPAAASEETSSNGSLETLLQAAAERQGRMQEERILEAGQKWGEFGDRLQAGCLPILAVIALVVGGWWWLHRGPEPKPQPVAVTAPTVVETVATTEDAPKPAASPKPDAVAVPAGWPALTHVWGAYHGQHAHHACSLLLTGTADGAKLQGMLTPQGNGCTACIGSDDAGVAYQAKAFDGQLATLQLDAGHEATLRVSGNHPTLTVRDCTFAKH